MSNNELNNNNNNNNNELNMHTAIETFLKVEKNKKAIEAFLKAENSIEKSEFKTFTMDDISAFISIIASTMDHSDLNSHVKNMTMIATSPMLKTMLVQHLTTIQLNKKLEKAKSETTKTKIIARLTAIEEDILKSVISVSKLYADTKEKGEINAIKTAIEKVNAELKAARDKKTGNKEKVIELEKELIALTEKLSNVEKLAETKKSYSVQALTDEKKDKFANSNIETFKAKIAEKVGYFVPNANKTGYKCTTAKADSEKLILENLKSVINTLWLNICQEDYEPIQIKKADKLAETVESTPTAETATETSGTVE